MKTIFRFLVLLALCLTTVNFTFGQASGVELRSNGDIELTGSTPAIFFTESGTGDNYGLLGESGDEIILNAQQGDLLFQTASTNRILIDQIGNVGIGTTTPSRKLDVAGDIEIEDVFPFLVLRPSANNAQNLGIQMVSTTGSQIGAIFYDDTNDEIVLENGGGSAGDVVIESNGRVGFGTSAAAGKLEAVFNSGVGLPQLMLTENSGTDFARITFRNTAAAGNDFWDIAGRAAGVSNSPMLNFFYNDGTSGTDILTLDGNNERVGIGTANTETALTAISRVSSSISTKDQTSGNYWDVGIGNASNNFKFAYNSFANFVADISFNTGAYNQLSDRNYKKNFEEIEDILPKLMQLKPTRYHFKSQSNAELKAWGFIAQDVEPIFPSFVSTSTDGNKTQKGIAYYNFSVLAIKAIQELKAQLDEEKVNKKDLEERITELEAELSEIKAMLVQLADGGKVNIANQTSTLTSATLEQNQPNPFTENTLIRYFIPETVKTASLRVTNLEGKQIKEIAIQHRGQGQVTLDANTLSAGTYQYTLILDGRILETKQMVLTRN